MSPTEEDIAWFKSTFRPIPRPRLPDDCVEYSLYLFSASSTRSEDADVRKRLRDVQKHASDLQKQHLKDYIWQRQGFSLELVNEAGLSLLHGRTEYGDSIEDEWLVVWLLRELTKEFDDLWVKVVDNDGEFLLIEAAETLPKWLEPEVADNRVWIYQGRLVIVKPRHEEKKPASISEETLTIRDVERIASHEPKRLMRSIMIEEESFYRLRNYPEQIAKNMHHALLTLPRKIVHLLRQKASYISSAVEAFYLRDPISLKPLQSADDTNLTFRVEDLVITSVTIPRVAYAQLRNQDFQTPKVWKGHIPSGAGKEVFARAQTGMKVSCGFEMLLQDPQNQDRREVREMKMLLEDLETGDDHLPTNADIDQWSQRQDDEAWLDVSMEDLEGELAGRHGKEEASSSGFGDKMAQENLQRLVAQFENFMNDDNEGPNSTGLFGEDSDDLEEVSSGETSDGEDKDTSFDEDQFANMMREMMGMPPDATVDNAALREMIPGLVQELESEGEEENLDDMHTLMARMEAELNDSGVLDLDPNTRKRKSMSLPDRKSKVPADGEAEEIEDNNSARHDWDINLMRNMVEKFKAQRENSASSRQLMESLDSHLPQHEGESSRRG